MSERDFDILHGLAARLERLAGRAAPGEAQLYLEERNSLLALLRSRAQGNAKD